MKNRAVGCHAGPLVLVPLVAWAIAGAAAPLPVASAPAAPAPAAAAPPDSGAARRLVFATFAGDATELRHALYLAESVREFAGALREAAVRVYAPGEVLDAQPALREKLAAARAEPRPASAPDDALRFPYARKVFAAAEAEQQAAGTAEILVWMDEDTIVLQEPAEFLLPAGVSLGYRPVTHRNIGSPAGQPPDEFWRLVYGKLAVPDSAVFTLVTPADSQAIRAYFNAGLLVVRPERGVLRRWEAAFTTLYRDPQVVAMCRSDRYRFLFLHQAALAGAVLGWLRRSELRELPAGYNFPIFFKEMYGAKREFNDLTGRVTLRYDAYFRDPAPDWPNRLTGPQATIDWLAARLGKE